MKGDLAAKIHRGIYGKSDKVNCAENGADFRAGYAAGSECDLSISLTEYITPEWVRRGSPEPESEEFDRFREWKRGFHAARMQRTLSRS